MVELTHHQQGVGADALAQHDATTGLAQRRRLDEVAVPDAELACGVGFMITPRWPFVGGHLAPICRLTLPPQEYTACCAR